MKLSPPSNRFMAWYATILISIGLGLVVLAALAIFKPAHATDFWVKTTGNDANPGTQASPFLTIQHADNASVAGFGAGSTIHVAPGIYPGSVGTVSKSGTPTQPITYLCDVKWACFIKATASETNNYAMQAGGAGTFSTSISSIASTSSNCAGPTTPCILVTLSGAPAYTLTTGQIIQITGAPTNTAANGQWAVTVVDSQHYTLNGSGFINPGATGSFRHGAAGAFTIFDGFDVDGTYPGTGQIWYFGIFAAGFSDIVRNNRVHDFAYVPGANNGSSGGACVGDGSGFYGQSQVQVYNNLVFHCGPKGTKQSRIHGLYIAQPYAKIYDNIVWGVSGICISSWHQATNQIVTNNTLTDCLNGTINVGAGDVDWPHILTGTPTAGSNVINFPTSTTAGLVVGGGVHDPTNTTCFNNPSLDLIWITAINSPTQITVSANAGGTCPGTADTLNFSPPNTGTYVANDLSLNGGTCGLGSFGSTIANTYTNNAQDSATTWCFSASGSETHVNDVTITGSCLVNYVSNDGNNTDWHLQYGCPAIAAGATINAPAFDFANYPVRAPVDIGAYDSNPNPSAIRGDKGGAWNWVAGGYSSAYTKDVFASSTATIQGTNGIGAQTRISSLDGLGNFWVNGSITSGWPSTGPCGQGCANFQNLEVNGVPIAPSPVPNPLCNASMDFDQQLAAAGTFYSINAAITSPIKTLDCWNAGEVSAATGLQVQWCPTGAGCTAGPPTGFANYLEAKVGTGSATVNAGDYFLVYQPVEAANITNYGLGGAGAQPLCFAFYSRSSFPNAVIGGAIQNAARNRSYPFTFAENSTANTWQLYSVCLPGDITGTWVTSGNLEGMRVVFALEAGATFQTPTVAVAAISGLPGSTFVPIAGITGAWAGSEFYGNSSLTQLTKTTGATFDVTGTQLEQSNVNNPFRRNLQFDEVQATQRYSWRLAEPAANVNIGSCQATAAAVQTCQITLPTTMRAPPSACSITTGTFKELFGGTANTWATPTGGSNTQTMATINTANGSDIAGTLHFLQGGGGTGVILCQARL